jgi:hypothetical protein
MVGAVKGPRGARQGLGARRGVLVRWGSFLCLLLAAHTWLATLGGCWVQAGGAGV